MYLSKFQQALSGKVLYWYSNVKETVLGKTELKEQLYLLILFLVMFWTSIYIKP